MSFPFAILFVGVLDRDLLVHEILSIHVRDGIIGRFEVRKRNKAVSFR